MRRARKRTGATIHDVAARAGVSVATVSRVLNRKEVVREETSRQVLDAAKALRYVPNTAARALSARRSQTIGIVLPEVHGEFFSEVIRGIDLAARAARYHILVSGSHSDAGEMLEVLETMRGRVDGVLVMAPDLEPSALRDASGRALPLVLLNSTDNEHDGIMIDNYGGARAMMAHLLSLGHRRIAFIKGPSQNNDARERLRGYRRSMRGVEATIEAPGDFTEASGHAAALALIERVPRPTVIFAANDSMAVGALAALAEARVAVPDEIAVAGFDDIPIARYITPPLTTLHVDLSELGRCAFALLLESMNGKRSRTARSERIAATLVVRQSCGSAQRGRRQGEK